MKVKIGKSLGKKSKVNLSYDVSSTASFGHCQPIMCREMTPNSEFETEVDSFVRLSPLVRPSFGRMKYKVWHNFIPIADIWKPFENMLTQQPYAASSGSQYVPSRVPYIPLNTLSKALYTMDFLVTPYSMTGTTAPSGADPQMYQLLENGSSYLGNYVKTAPNSVRFKVGNEVRCYYENYLASTTPWANTINPLSTVGQQTNGLYNLTGNWGILFSDTNISGITYNTGITQYLAAAKDLAISLDGADMVWNTLDTGVTLVTGSTTAATATGFVSTLWAQKLSDRQRNLRKVLIGLGYQLDTVNPTEVSILPLVAYYKAWFETLYPKRTKTWTMTNAFKLMERIADTGYVNIVNDNTMRTLFADFLKDLSDTYYFEDADFYSAHLASTAVGNAFDSPSMVQADTDTLVTVANSNNQQPVMDLSAGIASDIELRLLRILTKFVNKNSQIGGKIAEYLRAHYGADIINNLLQNYFIGGDSTDVVIDDVMSNASTDKAELADYAGKGVGYKDGKNYKFKADTFGYWVAFSALIPLSKWYQGIDPNLLHGSRFEFFTPEFDAVGFQISNKSLICNNEGINALGLTETVDGGDPYVVQNFGYIPRYSEYKLSTKNILNGDITLPSTRNDLCPYTLDRMLTPCSFAYQESGSTLSGLTAYAYPQSDMVADIQLRKIGANIEYGNYDRIFYASAGAEQQFVNPYTSSFVAPFVLKFQRPDDNFIVHHIVNIDAKVPMLAMSESFDTGADEDDAMDVDKV